jgi:anti-sigma factor RsiW
MKPFEEQFTAWVDGKLTDAEAAEFEQQLGEHPEAAAEKAGALKLGELLRQHSTAPSLSNPDFFNHQLQQRIAAETPRPAEKKRTFFWSIPRLAWAGAACTGVALLLYVLIVPHGAVRKRSEYFAQVVESWPKGPDISASTVYSPEDDVTVVWIDGLDYIPATNTLK